MQVSVQLGLEIFSEVVNQGQMRGALFLCLAVLTEFLSSANLKQAIGMQIRLRVFLSETCPGGTCTHRCARESSPINILPDSRRRMRVSYKHVCGNQSTHLYMPLLARLEAQLLLGN